jgi:phosphatidylethanolamine-binding protein
VDAPFQSFNFMSPILHWVQPDLSLAPGETALKSSTPAMCYYTPPRPPPGAAVHRYIFLLYDQPAGFDAKKHAPPDGQTFARTSRMRLDFASFEKSLGLGEVRAVNYFVSN